jgi:hypothetical protein
MGLTATIIMIAANEGCCKNVPKEYVILEEKKNDLEIYKTVQECSYREKDGDIYYDCNTYYPTTCPICSEKLNDTIINDLCNTLKKFDYHVYIDLKNEYYNLVKNRAIIDVFPQLESIYNEMEKFKQIYDDNKYFKLICEKEKKECYIKLSKYKKDDLDNLGNDINLNQSRDKRYDYITWKNDENLKNNLLAEREKLNKQYLIDNYNQKLKEEYEQKKQALMAEWENITFQKEYKHYQAAIQNIGFLAGTGRYYENLNALYVPMDYQYFSTRKKVFQYISQFPCSRIARISLNSCEPRNMDNNERIEFNRFADQRIPPPKYLVLLENKN